LGLPLRRALAEVAKLGVTGVQVDAVGDLAPQRLSETGRREFRHLLRSYNVVVTALSCPTRHGLDVAENLQPRLDRIKQVMSLSYELGAGTVVVEAGRIPDDPDQTRGQLMTEALLALGQHGDRTGTVLALETGLETGETLKTFLDHLDTGGLGVNYDPANLLLHGFDPISSLVPLQGRIKQVHAKDARSGRASRAGEEVPLGHGDIDWMAFLGTLSAHEYRGWLVIERESGENRLANVANGVAFLRRLT
jgi:sugar phosphate isomerase/epimerase